MNQTHYDQLLNTLRPLGYDETRSPERTYLKEMLMGYSSPARVPRWPREERPKTPARGSIQYLQALTQLVNRLR